MDELYPYQVRTIEAVLAGRNVILVAPTGSGKTLAASLPFFQNRLFEDQLLPGKALYVVPMRVLATQFQATCKELLASFNRDRLQKLATVYSRFRPPLLSNRTGEEPQDPQLEAMINALLAIQTGETPQDPLFKSMVTACTIDQMLASVLGVPYSVDARRANINVGAICSSYLILDEPHLYPLSQEGRSYKGALTTCLEVLRLLKGMTRFVFMSATMSSALVRRLGEILDADVITVDADELETLNKGRRRFFERASAQLDAQAVLRQHDRCSLVVCNTVQRAQELYLELSEQLEREHLDITLKLLHSRFTDEDRSDLSAKVCSALGKEQWQQGSYQGAQSLIVIATQVVEVGLDISAQIVHTELAPANSLIQRAGRCARFEQQHGRVIIYHPGVDEQGKPVSNLPYDTQLCEETWQALARYDGSPMGFAQEQELVDTVHTASDLALLDRYEDHRDDLQEAITQSLRKNERGQVTDLIRDVMQTQLIIHNEPEEILQAPWRYQNFSIHPRLVQGKHWDHLRERQRALDLTWIKMPVLSPTERQDEEEDSRHAATYTWQTLKNPAEIPGALMIAMPNQLVTYDKDLGLVFLDGRLKLSATWLQRLQEQDYQSTLRQRDKAPRGDATRLQSYEQHIGGLADAYHYAIHDELTYTMRCLELLLDFEAGTIDQAIQLAIATHDLGKLDHNWQRWARDWQRLLFEKTDWAEQYREPNATIFLAKTNYDYLSKEQREWKKEIPYRRPPHACESVTVGKTMLKLSLGITNANSPKMAVLRAICAAIAHHHTTQAHEYGATQIAPEALVSIQRALDGVRRESTWTYDLSQLKLNFEKGDLFPSNVSRGAFTLPDVVSGSRELLETWLAFILVRALRLADQRADIYVSLKR